MTTVTLRPVEKQSVLGGGRSPRHSRDDRGAARATDRGRAQAGRRRGRAARRREASSMSVAQQPSATIDWKTAVAAAEGLGRITLIHVARRDADAVREWCLQMARAHAGEEHAERALSYLELAVLTGHRGRRGRRARPSWLERDREGSRASRGERSLASEEGRRREGREGDGREADGRREDGRQGEGSMTDATDTQHERKSTKTRSTIPKPGASTRTAIASPAPSPTSTRARRRSTGRG